MNFKAKVRSMTASQIIMAMVDALTHPPIINIDMSTFGRVVPIDNDSWTRFLGVKKYKCFGCAATNTICKISGKTFTKKSEIKEAINRASFLHTDTRFLKHFERAIDGLRQGYIWLYNQNADNGKFVRITIEAKLLHLDDEYTNEDLIPYKQLAEKLAAQGL